MPTILTPEEVWRMTLAGDRDWQRDRRLLRLIPAKRRCKNCHAPATGFGAALMRLVGRGPFRNNPRFCNY